MRDNYDKRDKGIERKKRVLVDVGGQLFEVSPLPQDYTPVSTDEVVKLGSEDYPDGNSVLDYLIRNSK